MSNSEHLHSWHKRLTCVITSLHQLSLPCRQLLFRHHLELVLLSQILICLIACNVEHQILHRALTCPQCLAQVQCEYGHGKGGLEGSWSAWVSGQLYPCKACSPKHTTLSRLQGRQTDLERQTDRETDRRVGRQVQVTDFRHKDRQKNRKDCL